MSLLYLLRHAKAARAAPGMADFDRPLAQRGFDDAHRLGERMRTSGYRPDLVLCSPARRTRETWAALEPALGEIALGVRYLQPLYGADARAYLEAARSADEAGSAMIVGHNPMIEEVAAMLIGEARADGPASGFPTSALAVIRFDGPLSDAGAGTGVLEAFLTDRR